MLYKDYLELNKNKCPFCTNALERVFVKNKSAFLTYAIAPYHRHHLLVVPIRHATSLLELTAKEDADVFKLLLEGVKILNVLGYKNYSILMREGKNGNKSIQHLHYHLIPISHIGDLDHNSNARKIITEKQINRLRDVVSKAKKK